MVAREASRQAATDATRVASQATQHGWEVVQSTRTATRASRSTLYDELASGVDVVRKSGVVSSNAAPSRSPTLAQSGSIHRNEAEPEQVQSTQPTQPSRTRVPSMLIHAQPERIPASPVISSSPKPTTHNSTNIGPSTPTTSQSITETVGNPPTAESTMTSPDVPLPRVKEGRAVPSTRVGRAWGFAQLGVGLAIGTAVEGASRLWGSPSKTAGNGNGSLVINDHNADRLAASLCRMRGAALKMGQMLSIQDETLLPPALTRALHSVRQGADAMPRYQLMAQLESQWGANWRENKSVVSFDETPLAAASIGQVHRAQIKFDNQDSDENGNTSVQDVVVKVQYPGVGNSIESDLRNLAMLVKVSGLAPKGLFLENVIRVGQEELRVECDYQREKTNQKRIRDLVHTDPVLQANNFVVPYVYNEWTTDEILVSEYRPGGTIDKVSNLSQEERNRIGRAIMYLTMKELFVWRFMQTDPNWGNFLYDVGSKTTSLIDFGATREYSKEFVDGYLRIVWASANQDEATLMEQSHRMHFLTGDENEAMLRAHKLSGFTVGEPFWKSEAFDFQGSQISSRMGEHTSVFLRHRLTPPPEEVYTLHRKLAGAYMLCIKLGAKIVCRDMLEEIVRDHIFEDGLPPPVVH